MTPEEKLLALIQQDKRQAGEAARPPTPIPVSVAAPEPVPLIVPVPVPVPVPIPAAVAPEQPSPSLPLPLRERVGVRGVIEPVAPEAPQKNLKLKKPEPVVAAALSPSPQPFDKAQGRPSPTVERPPAPHPSPLPQGERVQKGESAEGATPSPPPVVSAMPAPVSGPAFRRAAMPLPVLMNRGLSMVALALIILVYYSVASARVDIRKEIDRQVDGAGDKALAPVALPDTVVPSLDECLAKIGIRNPFVAMVKGSDGTSEQVNTKADAAKDLKLVGVSLDAASPDESMAIIRNKADSKTVFVKLGQPVSGTDYVLSKVLADRVILTLRKQEFELK